MHSYLTWTHKDPHVRKMIGCYIDWVPYSSHHHHFKALHPFAGRQISLPDCPWREEETEVYAPSRWISHTCPCKPSPRHPPCSAFERKGVVTLSEFTGFILMQFSRQTVPRDLAQASLPNLQQITVIPTHALPIKTSFLWFLVMIREWGCRPWFMVTARWYCGFVMSV